MCFGEHSGVGTIEVFATLEFQALAPGLASVVINDTTSTGGPFFSLATLTEIDPIYGDADIFITEAGGLDLDNDDVLNHFDNCLTAPNPSQLDTDSDGYGNACDADFNGDDAVNFADLATLKQLFYRPPGTSGNDSQRTLPNFTQPQPNLKPADGSMNSHAAVHLRY